MSKQNDEEPKSLPHCSSPTDFPGGCPLTVEHLRKDTKAEHLLSNNMLFSFCLFNYKIVKRPFRVSRKVTLGLMLWMCCENGLVFKEHRCRSELGVLAMLMGKPAGQTQAECGAFVPGMWKAHYLSLNHHIDVFARGRNV